MLGFVIFILIAGSISMIFAVWTSPKCDVEAKLYAEKIKKREKRLLWLCGLGLLFILILLLLSLLLR